MTQSIQMQLGNMAVAPMPASTVPSPQRLILLLGGKLSSPAQSDTSDSQPVFDSVTICLRIANGDRTAEALMVAFYAPTLQFILHRRYLDPQLREDVFQDTFIKVIENLRNSRIAKPSALAAYIRSTAVNLAHEFIRDEVRRRPIADTIMVDQIADTSPGQLEILQNDQIATFVREMIDELATDRDREVLVRFYLDGDNKELICQQLGLQPIHFDRVLYRARQRLKQKVQTCGRTQC